MKKQLKSLLLIAWSIGMAVPAWSQATPSTEGRDFWVTFLQAQQNPTELILTISAKKACTVTVANTNTNYSTTFTVADNSSTVISTNTAPKTANPQRTLRIPDCYSTTNEQPTYTALHVSSSEDISLFAGNYISKTFDAANVLPTPALLDDYIIQVYPPSDHGGDNESRGSHFAIIATEDNTVVDYVLTAKTAGNKTGVQSTPVLNKGQVYYVWTGKGVGDAADLSGTTVKARDGKKIAVFQGCPHTNVPHKIRDRDHLFSQAMPTAYWGSEFAITSSLQHRRDIVAIMAINDGTEVYINDENGVPELVHTFDFSQDKKHYWTFEIGERVAYCNDSDNPKHPLDAPLVVDSSCYITTSCPAGVHLFMVSNKYDNVDAQGKNNCDPAMLWISPIEQVIKEINFSTYDKGTNTHYMNIVTTTADASNIKWTETQKVNNQDVVTDRSSELNFQPVMGNSDYSYTRIEINAGNHHLQGNVGFLAHVYGYGVNESYAYSCGSSTIQKSVTFNGTPLLIDSIHHGLFCVNEEIAMKLNIGNNDYQTIEWDYGDGITYAADPLATNEEKKNTSHTYTSPGWYDLRVSAVYVNRCTHLPFNEDLHFSFYVRKADTIMVEPKDSCLSLKQQDSIIAKEGKAYLDNLVQNGQREIINDDAPCYEDKLLSMVFYGLETEETKDTITGNDYAVGYNGKGYDTPTDVTDTAYNSSGCYHFVHYFMNILSCVDLTFLGSEERHICPGEDLRVDYDFAKGSLKDIDDDGHNAVLKVAGHKDQFFTIPNENTKRPVLYYPTMTLPTSEIKKPGHYFAQIEVEDEHCKQTKTIPIDFYVDYPKNIMKYKFNNVIAVYKPEHGGNDGYEFTNYEWHLVRNSQDTILAAGPNMDVLYLGEGISFEKGDLVYVILTDKGGVIGPLRSCKLEIVNVPNYDTTSNQNPAPATKRMVNRQIIIEKGDQSYNIYGQRVR